MSIEHVKQRRLHTNAITISSSSWFRMQLANYQNLPKKLKNLWAHTYAYAQRLVNFFFFLRNNYNIHVKNASQPINWLTQPATRSTQHNHKLFWMTISNSIWIWPVTQLTRLELFDRSLFKSTKLLLFWKVKTTKTNDKIEEN